MKRALTLTLGLCLLAAPAVAQDTDGIPSLGSEQCDDLCTFAWVGGAIGGAAIATTEIILIADGMIKAGHGHGLYAEGAALEVILGLAHLAPVGIAAWAVAEEENPDLGFVSLGFGSGVLALYFLIHGLWSFGDGAPPASHFAIGMAPRPGGATLEMGGMF